MDLQKCRVVLVRTTIPENLGATARVMRNMGLTDLVLVSPEADPRDRKARQLSTHGEMILENARLVPDLSSALQDCLFVAATSARIGGPYRRQCVVRPEEIMPSLLASLLHGPAALVFGPEATGLANAEVSCCHFLIHLPTDEVYPALNLAQAVAICLYELRRAWLGQEAPSEGSVPAPHADQERMFEHLRMALEEIHFLYGPNAGPLMHGLRHLIGRARPTRMEVDVLLGLARQIRWFAAHHRDAAPPA